ncbi:MAG: hypothetical protein ACXAE3_00265 [Candidatus Kariarchaeaceae archaeon]|jgi:hypothetical protein
MVVEKFALVHINRVQGPYIVKSTGFSSEDTQKILVFALPSGEAVHGSVKFIRLGADFYGSLIHTTGVDGSAKASVFAVDVEKLNFNPFDLSPILENMLETGELSEPLDDLYLSSLHISREPSIIEGFTHVIGSLFLMERVIVVGDHNSVLNLFATIYDGLPPSAIALLVCNTYTTSLHEHINLQGVSHDEDLADELEIAQKNSTIVLLHANRAFGLFQTPFTDRIEKLFVEKRFEDAKQAILEFVELLNNENINSASDFAKRHKISRADAKLLKNFQERLELREEMRRKNPLFDVTGGAF